jgi:hypothetical protein
MCLKGPPTIKTCEIRVKQVVPTTFQVFLRENGGNPNRHVEDRFGCGHLLYNASLGEDSSNRFGNEPPDKKN